METVKLKTCTKCKTEYPATGEYFNKHKEKKDGLRNDCKICRVQVNKAYYEANREKAAEYMKAWREANREKVAEYMKTWLEANREYKKAYKANSRKTLANRYIKELLRRSGISPKDITQLDIDETRERLTYWREIKLLTKQLKQNEKVNSEH